jgi:predicted signal transduction protein with EAL and GGDEF domain
LARYPQDGDDELTVVANADLALYQGKRAGGPHVVLYEPEIKARTTRSLHLEQAVSHAGRLAEIGLVYQPIVDLGTGGIVALEALARWTDEDLGEVNPLEFIGAAERTGAISRISERIFDAALLVASSWPAPVRLAINLSQVQVRNPSVPLMLARMLDHYRFSPDRLEIEFAQSIFLQDMEAARHTAGLFHDLGVRIVLDNFGGGAASLTCLKAIPFDQMKFDGTLLDGVAGSQPAQQLLAGALQLGKAMDIGCTATRVEQEDQAEILRHLGCQRGQGYFFGRPMQADAIAALLNPPDPRRQFSALLAFGEAKKAV